MNNPESHAALTAIRFTITPDMLQAKDFGTRASGVKQDFSDQTFDHIQQNPRQVKGYLHELRLTNPEDPTPAVLSSQCIQWWGLAAMQQQAEMLALMGDIDNFVMVYDTMHGMGTTASSIQIADFSIRGIDLETPTEEILSEPPSTELSISDTINVFMQMGMFTRISADLLRENPKGHLLIDEVVKMLRGEPSRFEERPPQGIQIPEYVAAGAELAQSYYRRIYPLTREVLRKPR